MSQGDRFRTNATFAVLAYGVLLAVMVYALGDDLLRPVAAMAPQVSWLMPDTTAVRVTALKAVGRDGTAGLYVLAAAISWGMIGALGAAGFAWGVLNKGATVLGVDKAITYLTAIAGLYALSTLTEVILHSTQLQMPQGGLHAIPALWFGAMIPSAAILARLAALLGHDVGALIAIAIDREPERLAELVASAESRRGADSFEARLARLMASRSAAS